MGASLKVNSEQPSRWAHAEKGQHSKRRIFGTRWLLSLSKPLKRVSHSPLAVISPSGVDHTFVQATRVCDLSLARLRNSQAL